MGTQNEHPTKDPEPASCQGLVLMQVLGPLGGPRDHGSHAPSLCLPQIPLRSCPAGPPAQLTAPQSPPAALITLGLGWQLSSLGLSFASARHSPTPGFLGHSSRSLLAAGRGAPGEWVRAPSRAQDQLGKAPSAIVLESQARVEKHRWVFLRSSCLSLKGETGPARPAQ